MMTTIVRSFLLYAVLCFSFLACAKFSTPPGGGPEDKTPPSIVEALSESNYQTNFSKKRIVFEFDEWITLSNPIKEIVISPPTNKPLQYSYKGKKIEVEFAEDEVLNKNTTYQINFGNAIKDFSVGNTFENFVFVFSTGPVIDSLSISGKVINQLDGSPAKGTYVFLYQDQADSVLYNQKPFYFSKTKEDGSFQLNNLRADTFQIFALKDENVSYTYDLPEEKVAFFTSTIVTSDSSNNNIILELFDEQDPSRYISREHNIRGLVKLAYSKKPKELRFEFPGKDSIVYYHESKGDSIFLWYKNMSLDSSSIIAIHANGADTIFIKKAKKSFANQNFKAVALRDNTINFFEGDSLKIEFERAINNFDSLKIVLSDSSHVKFLNIGIADHRRLAIHSGMRGDSSYRLMILPEGIRDWYKNYNADTLVFTINCQTIDALGKIELNLKNLDAANYVLELKRANDIIDSRMVASDTLLVFNRMQTGKYNLKIIEDINGDGEWTGGRLIGKLASERIKEITLDELKKGWELSLDVDIKEIFDGTEIK